MKAKMALPKVWKDCPDMTGDSFEIKCPKCLKDNKVPKNLFLPDSNASLEGLRSSGFQSYYLSKSRATIAYLIAAVITVVAVFIILPAGKIGNIGGRNTQALVFLVGIPTLVWWAFWLRLFLRRKMRVWNYACGNCGQELVVVSNGRNAAFGIVEGIVSSKKIEAKENAGGIREEKVEEKALDSLILDLKNGNAGVREQAAAALAGIGDNRRIVPLIEALKDKEPRVRKRVALTLVKVRDKKVIESLFSQSQTDAERSVRGLIRYLIANDIHGIRPARTILKGMENNDARIRDLAYEAFLNQQDSRALENLVQALKAQ
jgi:hypothetical protein